MVSLTTYQKDVLILLFKSGEDGVPRSGIHSCLNKTQPMTTINLGTLLNPKSDTLYGRKLISYYRMDVDGKDVIYVRLTSSGKKVASELISM